MTAHHNLSNMFVVAKEAALSAGRLLKENLRGDFQVSKKGRINLVTEIDLASESVILEQIRRHYPAHQVLAEESGSQPLDSDFRWIIDPLDGTTNYAHGYRFFCVSIALEVKGETVLGVVFDPVTEELFTVRRGGGAYLNGAPLRVSNESALGDSLLSTGFSYEQSRIRENLTLFNRLIMEARALRRDGSAALDLCYLACGRFDGFWELDLNPWDVAAGKLMVEEAGGMVTRFDGSPCSIYDRELLASNGRIHEQVIEVLRGD